MQIYTFQVEMINSMNNHSYPASIERKIDMTPAALTLERYDVFQEVGKAISSVAGDTEFPETKGTLVHITRLGNSGTDGVGGSGFVAGGSS